MSNGIRTCFFGAIVALLGSVEVATAQAPDHPVITEVFQNALGNDGPVGRLATNPHQEFIEIYLPTAADLAVGLNKDALNLSFYEIEGDGDSPGLGRVDFRIDLPTFDLDPSNGITPSAVPRPPSGVVVLGWVDYVGDPPTALAGTPSTRLGLVNGGITSASDFTFIAVNGAQFGGTINFPVPAAVSHIDLVPDLVTGLSDAHTGLLEQGSAAWLLVGRDLPGYAEICALNDPGLCSTFLDLPGGNPLAPSCLLDALAGNDDGKFEPLLQPYTIPSGDNIDLEFVLPNFGAFSLLVPQVEEKLHGYARLFLDIVKTTEDGIPGNENPATDSLAAYRTISNVGAIGPSPGRVHSTTSPAELEVADAAAQVFQVLTKTTARPAITAANIGGDFGLNVLTTPDPSLDPASMLLTGLSSSFPAIGQQQIFPELQLDTFEATAAGHTEILSVQVDASEGSVGDPLVTAPNASVTATFTAIDPTTGLDALGAPFQATAFIAVHGLPDQVGVLNEFAGTSLAQYVADNLGGIVDDDRSRGLILLDPVTDLSNPLVVDPLTSSLPDVELQYINPLGPPGTDDLVTTVLNSAEVMSLKDTYDRSFNATMTLLQAREFTIDETRTSGSPFTPTEEIHYVNALGGVGKPNSGFTNVTTRRTFELAIVDTNLGPAPLGFQETGATDDFGLIVTVGQTDPGSPVVTGEFVFLSLTGGLEGADVDTLDVPPHGNLLNIIYVDLDPLKTVLGVETITSLFIVDGSGGSEVDPMEVFTLLTVPLPGPGQVFPSCSDGVDNDGDGTIDWDGGANHNGGVPIAEADFACLGHPERQIEALGSRRCALGAELLFVLPVLAALRRRRA